MRTLSPRRPGRLALGRAAPWWRRSPNRLGRWLLAAGLAVSAATLVGGMTDDAAHTVAGLGVLRTVPVARHDLPTGRVVADDDLEWQARPTAGIPASTVDDSPVGRVVTAPIVADEIVSRRRLAPDGVGGLAALVPAGDRAVAVPVEGTGLTVRVDDLVDIIVPSTGDDGLGGRRSPTLEPVATDARVIDVSDVAITVAVSVADATALAGALGRGTPVVALVGRG
jgi:Flp pilus assembly protein CpaB